VGGKGGPWTVPGGGWDLVIKEMGALKKSKRIDYSGVEAVEREGG